eukprot:718109-Prorocentrum_minimum.AAC.1
MNRWSLRAAPFLSRRIAFGSFAGEGPHRDRARSHGKYSPGVSRFSQPYVRARVALLRICEQRNAICSA